MTNFEVTEGKPPTQLRTVFWKVDWLPPSETFVRNQIERWSLGPTSALGAHRVPSGQADARDEVLFGDSPSDRVARRFFYWTRRSARLKKTLRRIRPQVVVSHFLHEAVLIAPLLDKMRIPHVVIVHGHDVTALKRPGRRYRQRLRDVARLEEANVKIVTVSHFLRQKVLQLGMPANMVSTAYLGIPIPQLMPEVTRDIDLMFVGRLVEKKGVWDLIECLRRLDLPPLNVAIVGGGPLEDAIRREVSAISHKIEILGSLEPQEVRSLLGRAKVFVGPSKTASNGDSEGFGLVFLEAAAARVPVVSYRHGGVSEAVLDGVTGILVPEGDVDALTRSVRSLLLDEAQRAILGEAARQRCESTFNLERCLPHLQDIVTRHYESYQR